jgi:trehalose-6-phosphate synthase
VLATLWEFLIDGHAEALFRALTMSSEEQRLRIERMRMRVGERNVFRWTGRMLLDAVEIRERGSIERLLSTSYLA